MRPRRPPWMRRAMRARFPGAGAVRAAASGWTVQPWRLRVVPLGLDPPAAAPGLSALRVAFVADLHLRHPDRGVAPRVERALRAIRPDLVLVGGDTHDRPRWTAAAVEHLARYRAPLGTLVVPGNHEHRGGVDVAAFGRALAERGVRLLLNETVEIPLAGGALRVVGVDDPATRHHDLDRALAGVPADGYRLLLAHSGVILPEAEARGIPLVLSGHTHGGQVGLPWIGPPWLPRRAGPLVRGLGRANGTTLFVTSGAGTSILPVRWDCPPEVVSLSWRAPGPRGA
ncbi:MAG TPA: metallophosphoesterase [Planctomycetota bacterium]|nr:metallophosphoesterase [Planctomycetota bacterium]